MPEAENTTPVGAYVTPTQAAQRRGVARSTVYDAVRAGHLVAHQVLGKKVLLARDVDAWEVRANARRETQGTK